MEAVADRFPTSIIDPNSQNKALRLNISRSVDPCVRPNRASPLVFRVNSGLPSVPLALTLNPFPKWRDGL